jgi:hypothetical protein
MLTVKMEETGVTKVEIAVGSHVYLEQGGVVSFTDWLNMGPGQQEVWRQMEELITRPVNLAADFGMLTARRKESD